MSDYDLIVVGSGFAGSSATLAFCETAEREGRSGRVALLEVAKEGERAGASRWTAAFLRLTSDNRLSSEWKERMRQDSRGLADPEYARALESEVPNTVKFLEDHDVELVHLDEEDVALEFDEPSTSRSPTAAWPSLGNALHSYIEKYDNAEVHYETEAAKLSLSDEGRINGVVVRGPAGLLRP